MKRLPAMLCTCLFAVFMHVVLIAQSPEQREKVAEGEYWRWENGHPIKDTAQNWTIWRTKEGFEIESKLPPDKAALWVAAIGSGHLSASRELKDEAKNAEMVTNVKVQMDRDFSLVGLHANGKSLKDGSSVLVANCLVKEGDLACKGRFGDRRTKRSAATQVMYAPAGPTQFVSLLQQAKGMSGQPLPVSFVVLEEVKNKLQLSEVKGVLRSEGRDKLTIGEHVIEAEKFVVSIEGNDSPRQIALWASKQGIIFGMEDSRDTPGTRILLSQFKKYADF
jgi:hypothetical protein